MNRAPAAHFERLADESVDPWGYETSTYEQAKYRRTLEFLPARTGRSLEMGCSAGVFTEMLAPRCDALLAVDFSPTALDRAERRLAGHPEVSFELRTLPEETPAGPFDTILCCEVLYYWDTDLITDGLRRIESALAPGGTFLAVHWRGADSRRPLVGDDVHGILRSESILAWQDGEVNDDYFIDRWLAPC